MSYKRLIAGSKILVLAIVLAILGWNLCAAWREVGIARLKAATVINWRWSLLPPLGFAFVLVTSATAWIWLLRQMDSAGSRLQLYGAYFFSQMGKYVPGKVMLLLLRLERTRRLGVVPRAVTLSTIMENATFMISGAAIGILILARFLANPTEADHLWLLLVAVSSILILLIAIHPAVFYRVLNPVLRMLGRPEVASEQRLSFRALLACSGMMVPCWFFGGFALWATVRCLVPVDVDYVWGLTGVFALSVLVGVISFLPGGLGVREIIQALFLLPIVTASIPATGAAHAEAKLIVTLVVMLQRLFQIIAEAVLGLCGGWLTTSSDSTFRKLQKP